MVVNGISTWSLTMRLTSRDLPALGGPTMATPKDLFFFLAPSVGGEG